MPSALTRNSNRHNFLVSQCNELFLQLPQGEYILHDMGLKLNVKDRKGDGTVTPELNRTVQIFGLSTDPIDYWDDTKLEKLYSKLSLLLMRLYEIDGCRT